MPFFLFFAVASVSEEILDVPSLFNLHSLLFDYRCILYYLWALRCEPERKFVGPGRRDVAGNCYRVGRTKFCLNRNPPRGSCFVALPSQPLRTYCSATRFRFLVFNLAKQTREECWRLVPFFPVFYYHFDCSVPWGIISGFLSMLSALASLNSTPFWSDGDNVELIVIVLLIWLARVLSRLLERFKRTTRIMADSISNRAPNIPNSVPRNGFSWRNVGARAGEKSENGKTTAEQRRWNLWRNLHNKTETSSSA